MEGTVLQIPLICHEICKYLPVTDLIQCRRVNRDWNLTVGRILKKRGVENGPMIKITNTACSYKDISAHLKFLADRKTYFIEWVRAYKLDISIHSFHNMSEPRIRDFMADVVKLITLHGQQVVSIDLKYKDMWDNLLTEVLIDSHFKILFNGLKEIRFAIARLHHYNPEEPLCMIETLNSIPNLTRLTLCYTRTFQSHDEPFDYFCSILSKLDRLPQLEQLTVSMTYLSFFIFNGLPEMSSLRLLRIFVQGKARRNIVLLVFLCEKCPSLKELILIRLDSLPMCCNCNNKLFLNNDPDWLNFTRKLEILFPNLKIVVEKRY
ncbi:hypothetical protein Bhyg_08979 [Pseudolycoriella hygida]|uniref:F-box domain-containing protein n=1 Tax=Pseudolycoriella hygida TaxID=35572 RepID=A0A9Q0N5P4_9DIPT|nr:hypothetical protein Bhyg_08979 [Pseudolycoriella hygida]